MFRKPSGDPLAVTMPGVKLGDRLLVLGCSDPRLIAALAVKTGLTGRACAVDADEALRAAAAEQVQREGALVETFTVEWSELPFERDSFDVAVLRSVLPRLDAQARARVAQEAHRVLRGGGRCVTIDAAPRGGLAALLSSSAGPDQLSGVRSCFLRVCVKVSGQTCKKQDLTPLTAAGFRGVRVLAEREGLKFMEGIKPATAGT